MSGSINITINIVPTPGSGKALSYGNLPRYMQPCRVKLFDLPDYPTGGFIPNPTQPNNKKEPTMSSITLTDASIGKSFAARDGRRVDIIARNDKPSRPGEEFVGMVHQKDGTKTTYLWPASARVIETFNSGLDLIGEWQPFKVKIGGIYETRDGKNVGIVFGRGQRCFSVRWIKGPFSTQDNPHANGYCYENGKCSAGPDLPADLVKAVHPDTHEHWAAAKAYRLANELLTGKACISEIEQQAEHGYFGTDRFEMTFKGTNFELTVRE